MKYFSLRNGFCSEGGQKKIPTITIETAETWEFAYVEQQHWQMLCRCNGEAVIAISRFLLT